MLRMLQPLKHELILDAGCGSGEFANIISRNDGTMYGIDIEEKNSVRTRIERFCIASIEFLPFRDRTFNKIICSSVLQFSKDDNRALQEFNRVLKNQGRLVLNIPYFFPYRYIIRFPFFRLVDQNSLETESYLLHFFNCIRVYSIKDAHRKLTKHDFKIEEIEFSPKSFGAAAFEIDLLLRVKKQILFSNTLRIILYLLAQFDRLLPKDSWGTEFIIKARKVN